MFRFVRLAHMKYCSSLYREGRSKKETIAVQLFAIRAGTSAAILQFVQEKSKFLSNKILKFHVITISSLIPSRSKWLYVSTRTLLTATLVFQR